jgi:hypothetical protein
MWNLDANKNQPEEKMPSAKTIKMKVNPAQNTI